MGKVVVPQFMTLDGVIEDPGGSEQTSRGGWAFKFNRGPEGDKFKLDEVMAAEALLLGRTTYQGFAAAWPSRTDEFAGTLNSMPKFVVSTTLRAGEWNNSTVISGNVVEEVGRLKVRLAGDILINGSGQLVQTLTQAGLVDQYRLMVCPTVLGAGKRLFPEGSEIPALRLTEMREAGECQILIYEPKAA